MGSKRDSDSRAESLPIERIGGLSPSQSEALRSRWITTIDSFVAAAATEEGRAGLCSALEIEADQLDDVLQDARGALGEERYRELLAPKPGGPTGALLDDDQQQPADGSATGDEGT